MSQNAKEVYLVLILATAVLIGVCTVAYYVDKHNTAKIQSEMR